MKTVRCKFKCESVTQRAAWNKPGDYVYNAHFFAVTGGSAENNAFFDATPSGQLDIGTYKEDVFEVGKEYYLDISLAVVNAA